MSPLPSCQALLRRRWQGAFGEVEASLHGFFSKFFSLGFLFYSSPPYLPLLVWKMLTFLWIFLTIFLVFLIFLFFWTLDRWALGFQGVRGRAFLSLSLLFCFGI